MKNNRKTLAIAVVLLIFITIGTAFAQSGAMHQRAQQLLNRDEILARNYEHFLRETDQLGRIWHQQTAERAEANRQNLMVQNNFR